MTETFVPEVAEAALAHIRDHPEEWYQAQWMYREASTACGTACCLAGRIVLQHDWMPIWESTFSAAKVLKGNEISGVSTVARQLLGISKTRAAMLFDSGNSYAVLEGLVKHYSNNPVSPAPYTSGAAVDLEEYDRLRRESNVLRGVVS